jgi:hypothetical protein
MKRGMMLRVWAILIVLGLVGMVAYALPLGGTGDHASGNSSWPVRYIERVHHLAPEALILRAGFWKEARNLSGGLAFDRKSSDEELRNIANVMIIPTGALAVVRHDLVLKEMIEAFVAGGGSLVVLSQQYGGYVESFVPGGNKLRVMGFQEEPMCRKTSYLAEPGHPALPSCTTERIELGMDGYIASWPENATVLLRQKNYPWADLIYYPYKKGSVFITSLFTDKAADHNQASPAELRLFRDLTAFASNARAPIQTYDVAESPAPTILMTAALHNSGPWKAAKAFIQIKTADRKQLLYNGEHPVSLNPGERGQISLEFVLPETGNQHLGFCRMDYRLVDRDNKTAAVYRGYASPLVALRRVSTISEQTAGAFQPYAGPELAPAYIHAFPRRIPKGTSGPDIQLMACPAPLTIEAGDSKIAPLRFKNKGNTHGTADIYLFFQDTVREIRHVSLAPGAERLIDDIVAATDPQLPAGVYPFRYTIAGDGVRGVAIQSDFPVAVSGVNLRVKAAFERRLYDVGQRAHLNIELWEPAQTAIPLDVIVSWGPFHQKNTVSLTGHKTMTVAVPVDKPRQSKVFLGVYHRNGRAIQLREIPIIVRDNDFVTVIPERDTYKPGDTVRATFIGNIPGDIHFGEHPLIPDNRGFEIVDVRVANSGTYTLVIPRESLGGLERVPWSFYPDNRYYSSFERDLQFDVDGLKVKVVHFAIDKTTYRPGDTITAELIFEANQEADLPLRCWLNYDGNYCGPGYLGVSRVRLSPLRHTYHSLTYTVPNLKEPPTRLSFELYRKYKPCEDKIIVSESIYLNSPFPEVLAVHIQFPKHPAQSRELIGVATCYGHGTATLDWELGDHKARETVFLDGLTTFRHPIPSSVLYPRYNAIAATLTKDSHTSEVRKRIENKTIADNWYRR